MSVLLSVCGQMSAQILWKVEKPGTDKVSYILGTHHFAPVSLLETLKSLPEAMKGTEKLYGELDMELSTSPQAIMAMQQMLMAPADSTLDKLLTPAQLDSVRVALGELTGQPLPEAVIPQLCTMKPAALSTQIAAAMAMKIFPEVNPLEGLDQTMQARAKGLGIPVDGLETMEYQLKTLYGLPLAEQAEQLMKTVGSLDEEATKAKELTDAYLAHDIDRIEKLVVENADSEEDLERLIYTRNDNWVKVLKEEMPGQSTMVVVGIGHLPGERGVLRQLEKEGFVVTGLE